MAIIVPDLNPTATSNGKDVHVKVVQLLPADFAVGGKTTLKAILPADASIIEIGSWKETQWSGGGVTAATVSIGIPGTPAYFVNAADVLTPVAGTQSHLTPVSNIMQHGLETSNRDYLLQFTCTATGGVPTAGEMYVKIVFVR